MGTHTEIQQPTSTDVSRALISCKVVSGDSREMLARFGQVADLIVTSPPYADARKRHYDSIHPDKFAEWFATFHEAFSNVLKPTRTLVIYIKKSI